MSILSISRKPRERRELRAFKSGSVWTRPDAQDHYTQYLVLPQSKTQHLPAGCFNGGLSILRGKAEVLGRAPTKRSGATFKAACRNTGRQRPAQRLGPEDESEVLDSVTRSRQPPDQRFRLSVDTEKGTGGIGTYPDRGCVFVSEVCQGEKDAALGLL